MLVGSCASFARRTTRSSLSTTSPSWRCVSTRTACMWARTTSRPRRRGGWSAGPAGGPLHPLGDGHRRRVWRGLPRRRPDLRHSDQTRPPRGGHRAPCRGDAHCARAVVRHRRHRGGHHHGGAPRPARRASPWPAPSAMPATLRPPCVACRSSCAGALPPSPEAQAQLSSVPLHVPLPGTPVTAVMVSSRRRARPRRSAAERHPPTVGDRHRPRTIASSGSECLTVIAVAYHPHRAGDQLESWLGNPVRCRG